MTSRHPFGKKNRMHTIICFFRDSNLKDMPKKAKVVRKPKASKKRRAPSSRVIFARLGPRKVRSLLALIDILSDSLVDESGRGPIDLDKDIVAPFEPFIRCWL